MPANAGWPAAGDAAPGTASASVTLSEPSTSLSLGHDVLEHLLPPARVPSLDLRSLRATSRNARHDRDCAKDLAAGRAGGSARSVKPPLPPPNHGLHQDFLLWPSNRPENYPNGGPATFFRRPEPPRAPSSDGSGNSRRRAERPQTSRQLRPRTTDPGTLTGRRSASPTLSPSSSKTKRPSTSCEATGRRASGRRRARNSNSKARTTSSGVLGSPYTHRAASASAEKRCTSTRQADSLAQSSSMSPASALHPSSAFDADQYGDGFSFDENRDPRRPVVSPRLEEMAQPNAFRAREKHISADHSIVYTGAPPRLAYFKPEDLPDAAVYKQILPKREDHPELPTNTPTIKMHRPEALRKMRRVRRERLVAAAARGEPHAIRELAEKNERERVQLMKERRQRALRKAVFMRGLKRLTQSDQNDAKIRNRAKDGSQGVRRNSKRIALLKERKLKARAYVYREWDEYRDDNDGQLAGGVDENGRPIIRNKNTEDDNPRSVRRSINSFDMYVKEHEVIWAPKTAKQVLAEERLFKGIMKKAGPGMKKQFAEYMPKVSTGDMRKVIQIKRAGNRLLEDLLRQREGSTPDVDMAPAGHGWREEEIKAKLEKGVVLDDEED